MSKTLSQKVPFVEKLGYSLGDCSANLVFQMMMIYQAKFYTDVFGLEGSITLFACIGLVFFVITFLTSHERIAPPPSQKTDTRKDIADAIKNVPWRAMFILTLFVFTTLAMWGSAMNYYFENYVDSNALYNFLGKLGLVAAAGQESVGMGHAILNAFGLIVTGPGQAYEVGFVLDRPSQLTLSDELPTWCRRPRATGMPSSWPYVPTATGTTSWAAKPTSTPWNG